MENVEFQNESSLWYKIYKTVNKKKCKICSDYHIYNTKLITVRNEQPAVSRADWFLIYIFIAHKLEDAALLSRDLLSP